MDGMSSGSLASDSPPPGGKRLAVALAVLAVVVAALLAAGLWFYGQMVVRQGAAAVAVQAADLAAKAAAGWPGLEEDEPALPAQKPADDGLESRSVLPPRPAPAPSLYPPDIDVVVAAGKLAETLGKDAKSVVMLDQRGLVAMGSGRGGDLSSLPEVRTALGGRPITVLRRDGASRIIERAQPVLVRGRVSGALLVTRAATGDVGLGVIGLVAGGVLLIGFIMAGLVWRRAARGVGYMIEPRPMPIAPTQGAPNKGADLRPPLRHIAQALTQPGFVVSPYVSGELPDVAMPALALETVLAALIETSRKAGASRVDILADHKDDAVRLTLADDGADLRAADRHQVFQPLLANSQAEGVRGGLPIARSLVEAHGGELSILDPESGAAFQLRLPVVRAA